MGGEKGYGCLALCPCRGSPPHGRGKETGKTRRVQWPGITPAWAGKSSIQTTSYGALKDHPRMGGEKLVATPCTVRCTGSPPHGRGKATKCAPQSIHTGITPAWAGKSGKKINPGSNGKDHPRMGGEKASPRAQKCEEEGSPPHGRGKVSRTRFKRDQNRITPAWAGKRACCPSLSERRQDHPRMGGEKAAELIGKRYGMGSPPHGRGKVYVLRSLWCKPGITPAWAGKS